MDAELLEVAELKGDAAAEAKAEAEWLLDVSVEGGPLAPAVAHALDGAVAPALALVGAPCG